MPLLFQTSKEQNTITTVQINKKDAKSCSYQLQMFATYKSTKEQRMVG